MRVNPNWQATTSHTWGQLPMNASTSPVAPPSPQTLIHDPKRVQTCADFEELVDSEQAMLLAHLERPCPNCGHVSWPDEGEAP